MPRGSFRVQLDRQAAGWSAGQGRPYDLAWDAVLGRIPSGPGAHGLDQEEAAPVLILVADVRGLRSASAVVADEDTKLALVKGEAQPDERAALWTRGEHRVGDQLGDDELGRVQ